MKKSIFYILIACAFIACEKIDSTLAVQEDATQKEMAAKAEKDSSESSEDPEAKPAKTLKVGILGDSISTFKDIIPSNHRYYYPSEDVDDWTKTYWGILINQYWGAELQANMSYSGGCVAPTPDKAEITNFMTRCTLFSDPDIIIIHGGTNDNNERNNVGIGDFDFLSPLENLDLESRFRDSYIAMIRTLQKTYPEAQLILIIGNYVKGDYGESIEKIAQFFDLPYVDFRGYDAIDNNGNCHPNANGMALMASKIYEETKDLVNNLKLQ